MNEKETQHDVVFSLFAPNNREANLIGDFSNWQEIKMEKSDDGYFRTGVKLADGTYQYKFQIQSKSWFYAENEWQTVNDPYATDVDKETGNAVLRVKDGHKIVDEYEWKHDAVPLPNNYQIVIYEMHVGDFSGGENDPFKRGKYTNVVEKLNYLTELGVNAIELMPVKESPGEHNWGYSPINYFATDSYYGTTEQLKEMIDSCHALGIRVIADGVYNHASTENPLTQIDHDYWFHHDPKDPNENWGPEFNYENFDSNHNTYPARKFILDSMRFWINEYHIDGMRYDAARQLGNFEAMRDFVALTHETASIKPFFNVAEYIPTNPVITQPQGPMDSCWNDTFMFAVVNYLKSGNLNFEEMKKAIDCKLLGFADTISVVNYLSNHDQNRLMKILGENGILGAEAYQRAKFGAAILFTAVGVPMIWMGEEFGEYAELREDENKINWTLLETAENKELFEHYKTLINLRKTHAALHAPNISFFHEDAETGVLGFSRYTDDGNLLAVILNFSGVKLENYQIDKFPENGEWHEWLKNYDTTIEDNSLTASLESFEALIFIKK